jgi:hypothetical protein
MVVLYVAWLGGHLILGGSPEAWVMAHIFISVGALMHHNTQYTTNLLTFSINFPKLCAFVV